MSTSKLNQVQKIQQRHDVSFSGLPSPPLNRKEYGVPSQVINTQDRNNIASNISE